VSGWVALDGAQVQRLAAQLVEAGRGLGTTSGRAVAAALGWPVVEDVPGTWLVLQPEHPLGGDARVVVDADGTASEIFAPVSSVVPPQTPEARAFVQDAFAAAAAALTERYGPPARRDPGPDPEVAWRTGDLTVELFSLLGAVRLRVAPTALIEEQEASPI
jgi:hypothetical protein